MQKSLYDLNEEQFKKIVEPLKDSVQNWMNEYNFKDLDWESKYLIMGFLHNLPNNSINYLDNFYKEFSRIKEIKNKNTKIDTVISEEYNKINTLSNIDPKNLKETQYKRNRRHSLYRTFRKNLDNNKMFEYRSFDINLLIPWFKSIYPELSSYIENEYYEILCNDKFFENFEIEVYKYETEEDFIKRCEKEIQDIKDIEKYGGNGTCGGTVESHLLRKSKNILPPLVIKESNILDYLISKMNKV